jgi:hypothetical protein
VQGNVKSTFDAVVGINYSIEQLQATIDVERITAQQCLAKVSTNGHAGLLALPVNRHVRTAFSKSDQSFSGLNSDYYVECIVISSERSNKGLYQWNTQRVKTDLFDM